MIWLVVWFVCRLPPTFHGNKAQGDWLLFGIEQLPWGAVSTAAPCCSFCELSSDASGSDVHLR